jgi:hypothetical protein
MSPVKFPVVLLVTRPLAFVVIDDKVVFPDEAFTVDRVSAPVLLIVASPDSATSAATLDALPTKICEFVSGIDAGLIAYTA